jgi:hypothetical protein
MRYICWAENCVNLEATLDPKVMDVLTDVAKAKEKGTRGRNRKSAAPASGPKTSEPNLMVWICEEAEARTI